MKKQKQTEISNSPDLTQIEGGEAIIWTHVVWLKSPQPSITPTHCKAITHIVEVFLNQKAWKKFLL